jgi:uncharacterized protein YkwD
MPKHAFLVATLFLSALVSCGPQLNITAAPQSPTAREIALAEKLHHAVNAHRGERGARQLALNATMNRYATLHSQFLRANPGKFSINGPNISHDGFALRHFALTKSQVVGNLGENVARADPRNSDMATHLVNLWAGSARHEQNMLQDWTLSGIGIAMTPDDAVYATLLLGSDPSSSHRDLADNIRVHY